MKLKKIKIFLFLPFILILISIFLFSNICYAQVIKLADIKLDEGETVYNIYADPLQKNFAVVIKKTTEGIISTKTEYYVVTNNNKLGPFDYVNDFCFFDNSNKFLISCTIDDKYYVLTQSEKAGPFEFVGRFSYLYSKNYFAFKVKENGQYYVVTSEKKFGPYNDALYFVVDQKIEKIAWVAKSDLSELYINGKLVEKAELVKICGFYTEKRLFSYIIGGKSQKYTLVVGSNRYGPYENIGLDLAVKDEGLVLFFAQIDGNWYLIAGKEKAGPYEAPGFVTISPDYKKISYAVYKSDSGWNIYIGSKLIRSKIFSYLWFFDFIKVDENYEISYLIGNSSQDLYIFKLIVGNEEKVVLQYYLNIEQPYIAYLNLQYYGVDFSFDINGTFAFVGIQDNNFIIGIYNIKEEVLNIYGPSETYDDSYVLDVAENIVYFVFNGEFYLGTIYEDSFIGFSKIMVVGTIVYGIDGSKIGIVYFNPNENAIYFADIGNAQNAIISVFE